MFELLVLFGVVFVVFCVGVDRSFKGWECLVWWLRFDFLVVFVVFLSGVLVVFLVMCIVVFV